MNECLIAQKGKNIYRLLELQKVAPNAKSCQAQLGQQITRIPANSNHFPFVDPWAAN